MLKVYKCLYRRYWTRSDDCFKIYMTREKEMTVFLPGKSHGQRSLVGYSQSM